MSKYSPCSPSWLQSTMTLVVTMVISPHRQSLGAASAN